MRNTPKGYPYEVHYVIVAGRKISYVFLVYNAPDTRVLSTWGIKPGSIMRRVRTEGFSLVRDETVGLAIVEAHAHEEKEDPVIVLLETTREGLGMGEEETHAYVSKGPGDIFQGYNVWPPASGTVCRWGDTISTHCRFVAVVSDESVSG